ncbi:adenylate/guanylate cyclase domain-containing protein [Sneathiella glossodoripedis]|uniref:adenylate/guanylate cyclase domain-containing protein n=1 Tax=Sneathiella glossodoripedis TaxID=418853 RepID=UPI000685C273|nr:adenylate/guanylate cyclase domain-containing protein [Sneathiella glossodoripedis]
MQQVIDWVLSDGRREKDALSFINTLCDRILGYGIPIARMRIGFRTIHPQLDIWAYIWTREDGRAVDWGGEHGIRSSSSYYGSPAEWVHKHQKPFRRRLDRLDPETDHNVLFEQAKEGLVDYLMLPMWFMDDTIPIITFVTDHSEGFTDQMVADLEVLAKYVSPIIEIHANRKIAVTLLETYVGHRSGQHVLEGQIQRGDGEEIEAAIWFCDLRGFTRLSNSLPKADLFSLLNTYFEIVGRHITENNGEILKFVGDAVLAVFPKEHERSKEQCCADALSAAQSALAEAKAIKNVDHLNFGIGLHYGKAMFGNVGTSNRLDFTVIGHAVNLASRVEALTKSASHNLLLSEDFATISVQKSNPIGVFNLHGIEAPQTVYFIPDF